MKRTFSVEGISQIDWLLSLNLSWNSPDKELDVMYYLEDLEVGLENLCTDFEECFALRHGLRDAVGNFAEPIHRQT